MTDKQLKALKKFRNAVKALDEAGMSVFVASGSIDVYCIPELPVTDQRGGGFDRTQENYTVEHKNDWDGGDY